MRFHVFHHSFAMVVGDNDAVLILSSSGAALLALFGVTSYNDMYQICIFIVL